MSPFVRKVRTASGATAVQIVAKEHGVRRIVEHLGSAHDEAELAVLVRAGRDRITALSGQAALDLESLGAGACVAGAVVDSKRCALLWDALSGAYERLGLGEAVGGDEGFKQMALARCVEPTSKEQVPRVIGELGVRPVAGRSLFRSLARCVERDWRAGIAAACLSRVTGGGDLSLCLYDVTTLYFEADKEDDLRRVGDCQGAQGRSADHRGSAGGPGRLPPADRLLGGRQGRNDHHRAGRPGVRALGRDRAPGGRGGRRHAVGRQSGGPG